MVVCKTTFSEEQGASRCPAHTLRDNTVATPPHIEVFNCYVSGCKPFVGFFDVLNVSKLLTHRQQGS